MAVPLVIALAGLLAVACALLAIVTLQGSPFGWELLLVGLYPVLPAALMVTRNRYAEAFLRLTAMVAVPLGPAVLLAILLRGERPVPTWAVATVVLGTIAGVVSVIAIAAGARFLRAAGVQSAGVRATGGPAAVTRQEPAPSTG